MHLLLLRLDAADDLIICYFFVLWHLFVVIKKHSVPSMSLTPRKKRMLLFAIALSHFGLSGTFTRCMYYCTLSLSGKINFIIWPGWTVTSHVLMSLIYQSSSVFMIFIGKGALV